jgi:hypothetical protein
MLWRRLGHIFNAGGEHPWMLTHAANPVAVPMRGHIHRFYFSTRDAQNRSSVAWIEVDLREPQRILRRADRPVLSPGEIGSFDDSGCSIGCIFRRQDKIWLYYMGWNLGVTVPWRNSIGLAISADDGESFMRVSRAPIMDRSDIDPFTLSYPWVIEEPGGLRMWYGSNLAWGAKSGDMNHVIKSAASHDGIAWDRDGKVAIIPADASEYAFARPCVVRDRGLYRMWYAFRGDTYRIGYADSVDGQNWARGPSGFDLGCDDWDNQSAAYPCVFDHAGRRYMLYCGNGYGRTGFGLAVLEEPTSL